MIEKVYKLIYWLFLLESLLILHGINQHTISYGIDMQTPLMQIGIMIALGLMTVLKLILGQLNTKTKLIFGGLLTIIMIGLCCYYVLEDQFKLNFT